MYFSTAFMHYCILHQVYEYTFWNRASHSPLVSSSISVFVPSRHISHSVSSCYQANSSRHIFGKQTFAFRLETSIYPARTGSCCLTGPKAHKNMKEKDNNKKRHERMPTVDFIPCHGWMPTVLWHLRRLKWDALFSREGRELTSAV